MRNAWPVFDGANGRTACYRLLPSRLHTARAMRNARPVCDGANGRTACYWLLPSSLPTHSLPQPGHWSGAGYNKQTGEEGMRACNHACNRLGCLRALRWPIMHRTVHKWQS